MKQEFMQKIYELIKQDADIDSLYKQLCLFKNRGMSREKMLECLENLQENHEMEERILELMDFVTGFCSPHMTVYKQKPSNVMPLYETETEVLERFMESVCIEEKISEDYLILYNFATDCKYVEEIQPQVLQYLLPFYLKCVREYVLEENPIGKVKDAVSSVGGSSGDIVIPVYLGGAMLDEVIVNAQQRANLRSGGR